MYVYKQIYTLTITHTFCTFFELNIETMINAKKTGIFHIFEKPKSSSTSFKIQRSSEVYASARGVRTSPCPWPSAGPESPNWPRTDEFSSAVLVMWLWWPELTHIARQLFCGQKRTLNSNMVMIWLTPLLLFKRQFWKADFSHSTVPYNINQ